jgi:subtilisin family serine protease
MEDGEPTAILTGSSVATTVVAAAAAVVWHHRPELRRAEVMELLRRSGGSLERDAERPTPRRVAGAGSVSRKARS